MGPGQWSTFMTPDTCVNFQINNLSSLYEYTASHKK